MLTIANAWAAGGRSALEATRHAGSKLEVPQDVAREVASALDLADELESAESELHYQVRESIEKYRQTLEWRRAVGFRLLQVIVAVMVGFIVISVYLPIFKMGAVV
jgi:type II secretory pathway component PulF